MPNAQNRDEGSGSFEYMLRERSLNGIAKRFIATQESSVTARAAPARIADVSPVSTK
jgi:hypothetical protein